VGDVSTMRNISANVSHMAGNVSTQVMLNYEVVAFFSKQIVEALKDKGLENQLF